MLFSVRIDYLRKKKYESELPKGIEEMEEESEEGESFYTEKILELALKEIDQLPVGKRVIMKMFYVENLSIKEIANRLHVTYKTVCNQKLRAIETLYSRLISGVALNKIG